MKANLNLSRTLPIAGIVAFSLCSVWSLYHLFVGHATHATLLFWGAAALVELITAWLVYMSVDTLRKLTRSNLSKQDRKFYGIVLIAFLVLTAPTLGASIWANTVEFGNPWLGLLFPVASVACAIGAALPEVSARFEKHRANEKRDRQAERKKRESQRQAEATRGKTLASLGKAGETLRAIAENPTATQGQIAATVGISRRSVGNHLGKLEAEGYIKRNGSGIEVL